MKNLEMMNLEEELKKEAINYSGREEGILKEDENKKEVHEAWWDGYSQGMDCMVSWWKSYLDDMEKVIKSMPETEVSRGCLIEIRYEREYLEGLKL